MTPVIRITMDLPISLNDAVNQAVKKTSLSKAAYVRMALEVMNMISEDRSAKVFIEQPNGLSSRVLIPGVLS